MTFIKVSPSPGMFTDGTRYSAKGTWYDADKVRFRKGFAEKIGGWSKFIAASFLGTCRAVHDWVTDGGSKYVAVGTHLKLYVQLGGAYYDITPVRSTVSLGTDPIATIDETAVITFTTSSAHGAVAGDYVTIAGATASGGIGTGSINKEHRIVALGAPDGSNVATKFRVVCDAQATGTDTAEGGSSVTAAFQINTGLDVYVDGAGWGSSTWGSDAWGSASALGQSSQLRLWSIDTFGEDLLACVRQGKIYYWDESGGTEEVEQEGQLTLLASPISVTNTSSVITSNGQGWPWGRCGRQGYSYRERPM
jgi:hypothetical protein